MSDRIDTQEGRGDPRLMPRQPPGLEQQFEVTSRQRIAKDEKHGPAKFLRLQDLRHQGLPFMVAVEILAAVRQ